MSESFTGTEDTTTVVPDEEFQGENKMPETSTGIEDVTMVVPDKEFHGENRDLKQFEDDSDTTEQGADVAANSDYSNISSDENVDSKEDVNEVVALAEEELPKLNVTSPSNQQDGTEQDLHSSEERIHQETLSKSERELKDLCTNMFAKLEGYLKGEVASSVEDYVLLEKMNQATLTKYQEMLKVATSVGEAMHEVNHKFSDLKPHLEHIEQIEQEVLALEQAAYKLDGCAKKLEERFRKLEKR